MQPQVAPGLVYFVGAGPGHPGLITLRGVECLRRADAVLYDYLANCRLLCYAPPHADLVCLGRHGRSTLWSQSAINNELVHRARQGQCVVRLKGGDPMVFGRATEELAAVASAGLAFEVVPGVTAAAAASAFAGITITDRDYASAVAFVTGHEQLGKRTASVDYDSLASFPGTLVVYMGVQTVAAWSEALVEAGKSGKTPVLAIRRASWPDQQVLQCTLAELPRRVRQLRLRPPVVFVVGEAAVRNPAFDWFARLPLLGKNIVVTRPRHQAAGMLQRLGELGANALLQPGISVQDPADWRPVDQVIGTLSEFDVLIFSSANGVNYFMQRLLSQHNDVRRLANVRLAVIGPRTADALAAYHLRADIQPLEYRAEALAAALVPHAKGKKCLLIRASRGREILAERLQEGGAQVAQVVAYQSDDVTALDPDIEELLAKRAIHWVTVTSSAIAKSVCQMMGARLRDVQLASISPITSQTLREEGFEPHAEAAEYTTDGVIDAILASTPAEAS